MFSKKRDQAHFNYINVNFWILIEAYVSDIVTPEMIFDVRVNW